MKKLICILAAVMLIFAVSCSNDNPSPDATAPVINAPNFNTNYSDKTYEEKMTIFFDFLQVTNTAYDKEYSALKEVVEAEKNKAIAAGQEKGTVTKSNADGTITVIATFDLVLDDGSTTGYINNYEYEKYTIWGVYGNYIECTIQDNDKEPPAVTKFKYVFPTSQSEPEYYLNDEKLESVQN